MNHANLTRVEAEINRFSLPEQLWLMERLAARIRQHTLRYFPAPEDTLAAMATDPDIQRELRQIEAEFAGTEADGMAAP